MISARYRLLALAIVGAILLLFPFASKGATCSIPGTRPATADDAVVKNGQLKEGTCYNPNEIAINQNVEQAKQFLNGLPKRPLSNCAPPNQENISRLNDAFAVCAAGFLKAYSERYGTVYITSAYRDAASGANKCAGGAPGSNHTRGVAMDVNPANESMYPTLWKFASDNPQFGVCFPFQDGRTGSIFDRPHMVLAGIGGSEGTLCARQGIAKVCSGVSFKPQDPTVGEPYPPSPTSGLTERFRQALGMPQQPSMPAAPATPPPSPVTSNLPLPSQSQFCLPEYRCSGNNLVYQNSFCATQVQQICPAGCLNGACMISTSTSASTTNDNTNTNTNEATSTIDLLEYLGRETATSTTIATATPLQLILALSQNRSYTSAATSSQPTVASATNSTMNFSRIGAQQTFTSSDLNPAIGTTYVPTGNTALFAVLEKMKVVLLRALEYLRPFSPERHGYGDGHA